MSKDKDTLCGAIGALNELRRTQEPVKKGEPVKKVATIDQYLSTVKEKKSQKSKQPDGNTLSEDDDIIYSVEPDRVIKWKYKDRPEDELGDIDNLSETFKSVGQQQPCVVRPIDGTDTFELIVGERRWQAARKAGMKLKVVVRDVSDKIASLIQVVENEKREGLSDFAKGMSYSRQIEKGLIQQKDLIDLLGISKQQVTKLLSFRKIPKPLFDAIGDFKKVSGRTAYELARLANKGDAFMEILIAMAPRIRDGKCGHTVICREVEKALSSKESSEIKNLKGVASSGRHVFTWRIDSNSVPSIHFPKEIGRLIQSGEINIKGLTSKIEAAFDVLLDRVDKNVMSSSDENNEPREAL